MNLPTISPYSWNSAWPEALQLFHAGVNARTALPRQHKQPEPYDFASIEQVTLPTELCAKCFDSFPILRVERKRCVLR